MSVALTVFTGLIGGAAMLFSALEERHCWAPWVAVAAGLLAMAVSS